MLYSSFDFSNCNLPPLGTLDVIGKQRRAAWSQLGEYSDNLGPVIRSLPILIDFYDPRNQPLFLADTFLFMDVPDYVLST